MKRQVAIISDCASPLTLGERAGQCVYVAELAKNLAALGYEIDVFTRRDAPDQPEVLAWTEGVRVIYIPAGPAGFVRKEDLFRLLPQFTSFVLGYFKQKQYDIAHANFFLSGLTALNLKRATETPFVITFHELGRVSGVDEFPPFRYEIEDRIVREADAIFAHSQQEEKDLMYLYDAAPEKIVSLPILTDKFSLQLEAERIAAVYEEILTNKILLSATVRAALQNLRQKTPQSGFPLKPLSEKQNSQNLVS